MENKLREQKQEPLFYLEESFSSSQEEGQSVPNNKSTGQIVSHEEEKLCKQKNGIYIFDLGQDRLQLQDSALHFKGNSSHKQTVPRNSKNCSNALKRVMTNVQSNDESNQNIKGIKMESQKGLQVEYVQEKKALKIYDLKKFICSPLQEPFKITAVIKKEKTPLLSLSYKMTVFVEQNEKFLLSVLREGLSSYIFSLSKENISSKNKNYLGRLQTNFAGTEFILFDDGFSPSQTRFLEHCHRQLAYILYQDGKGPRKFQTCISHNGFAALQKGSNILKEKWQRKERAEIIKFYNQMPEYDAQAGVYKLDFKGLVGKESVKNFILSNDCYGECLLFGKRAQDLYVMEVCHPFSVLEAVAICVSSIHYKLNLF